MTLAESAALAAEVIAEDVAARLVRLGATIELQQLSRLSSQEFDVMLRREREAR